MVKEIPASLIGNKDVFESAVEAFIKAMRDHNKTVGEPRPIAHPLVEAAVKRVVRKNHPDTYEPHYTIIDDAVEVLPPTLAEKKAMLHNAVIGAEMAAKEALCPMRKRPLLGIQANEGLNKPVKKRTKEEKLAIALFEKVSSATRDIELKSAVALSEIEDLTAKNIDKWKVPSFE